MTQTTGKTMQLQTPRLILRDLSKSDEPYLVKNLNDLEVSRYLLVVPYPYTIEHAKSFIEKAQLEAQVVPRTQFQLGIELKDQPGVIGMIGLTKIDYFRGLGMIGYWLGREHQRKGLMTEALERMLFFAFEEIKLRRIDISATAPNKPSNKLIENFRFTKEGTRRQRNRVKSTGEIYDENVYGMLLEDWKNDIKNY
jgi:RimJ/RimL family protein N-acetyltransferase